MNPSESAGNQHAGDAQRGLMRRAWQWPWIVHVGILASLAAVGALVTVADRTSGGFLAGVATFFYWSAYSVLVGVTTLTLLIAHLAMKRKRPGLAFAWAYSLPLAAVAGALLWSWAGGLSWRLDRWLERREAIANPVSVAWWELRNGLDGGCDAVLAMGSATDRVVSFRATYREFVSRETVHRIPSGDTLEVVQPLYFERYRATDGSVTQWQPRCGDVRPDELVFLVHYGDVRGVELVFALDPPRSTPYRTPGLVRQVHQLSAPR